MSDEGVEDELEARLEPGGIRVRRGVRRPGDREGVYACAISAGGCAGFETAASPLETDELTERHNRKHD